MSTLTDLHHLHGFDLALDATGDLAPATGSIRSQQRLLRRLLTNAGEYLFHLDYGAGLPAEIGEVVNVKKIRALIQSQLGQEEGIASNPAPEIDVTPMAQGVSVNLKYWTQDLKQPVALSFNVNR